MRLAAFFLMVISAGFTWGQTCDFAFTFRSGDSPKQYNNKGKACYNWQVTYFAAGLSVVNMQFESAPDAGSIPGAFAVFAGTLLTGSNPMTATTQATSTFQGSFAWIRINPVTLTGSGTVTGRIMGQPLTNAQFPSPFSVSNPCVALGQRACTPPDTTLFAWRNQTSGGATASETVLNGIPRLLAPANAGNGLRGREIAVSQPFTVRSCGITFGQAGGSPRCGIYLGDNTTGRLEAIERTVQQAGANEVNTERFTTAVASAGVTTGVLWAGDSSTALFCYSITDNGVNHIFRVSPTGVPAHEITIRTSPRAEWLAATDRAGYFCESNNAAGVSIGDLSMFVYLWELTVP